VGESRGETESDAMRTHGIHSIVRPTYRSITKKNIKRNDQASKHLRCTGKDVFFLISLVAEGCASSDRMSRRNKPPDDLLWIRRVARFLLSGAGQRPTPFTILESRYPVSVRL
jgi:hypothetical protein